MPEESKHPTTESEAVALHRHCSPLPTAEEILAYRKALTIASRLEGEERQYSDAEVIAALTEPMSDTGGTALGEMRAINELMRAFGWTRGKKRQHIKEQLWAKGCRII